jgi:alkanesulfonate monooxygenase SsuD/methylene tetrahydromethanopterin reductase-like flavin-dependent oxidoreductase (luciferase family)
MRRRIPVKLGIGITTFPWPADEIGPAVSRLATAADDAGVDSLWVMDHFFQIRMSGLPPESPMPEAYATLAFLGARDVGGLPSSRSPGQGGDHA